MAASKNTVGSLTLIFGHSELLSKELEAFVDGFEGERGNDYAGLQKAVDGVQFCLEIHNQTVKHAEHLNAVHTTVNQLNTLLKSILANEEQSVSTRNKATNDREPMTETDMTNFLGALDEERQKLENDTQEKRRQLHEQYKHVLSQVSLTSQ